MPQNPFYVDPSLDITPGLRGLQAGVMQIGKRKEKEEAESKKKAAATAAITAYKTNDPDKIAEAILMNPEIGDTLGELYDKRRDYEKDTYVTDIEKLLTEIETTGTIAPPQPSPSIAGEVPGPSPGTPLTGLAGGTPSPITGPGRKAIGKTDIIKSVYQKNPKAGKQMLEYEFAKNDSKRYKAWKDVYRPDKKATGSSLKKMIDERQALIDSGVEEDDPRIKAYDEKSVSEYVDCSNLTCYNGGVSIGALLVTLVLLFSWLKSFFLTDFFVMFVIFFASVGVPINKVGEIIEGYPAAIAGIEAGDEINHHECRLHCSASPADPRDRTLRCHPAFWYPLSPPLYALQELI